MPLVWVLRKATTLNWSRRGYAASGFNLWIYVSKRGSVLPLGVSIRSQFEELVQNSELKRIGSAPKNHQFAALFATMTQIRSIWCVSDPLHAVFFFSSSFEMIWWWCFLSLQSAVSYECSQSQLNTETASTCNLQIDKLLLAIKYTKAAWLIHQLLKAAFSHACAQFSCLLIDVIIYYISTGLALAKLNCNLVILDDRKSWKQKLLEICWSASWSQLRSF